MIQETEISDSVKSRISNLPDAPSQVIGVTMTLGPKMAAVGQGEPLVASGRVTILGLPSPAPMLLLIQGTRRGDVQARPLAQGFSMPGTGTFAVKVPTQSLEYGEYAFQALAFPPVGTPGLSRPNLKRIEAPRYGMEVFAGVREAGVGGTIDVDYGTGDTIYVDHVIKNMGNRSDTYEATALLVNPSTGRTITTGADIVNPVGRGTRELLPGESSNKLTLTLVVLPGEDEGYYDGILRIRSGGGAYADHETPRAVRVYRPEAPIYTAGLSGVTWRA